MNASKGTLLVVDDEPLNLQILKQILLRQGYTVQTALNGREALQQIQSQAPDLVLLDIVMPDLSGMEVLKEIRKSHSAITLPVIMLTAKGESEDIVEALNHGANEYITKPVDIPGVLSKIQGLLVSKKEEA